MTSSRSYSQTLSDFVVGLSYEDLLPATVDAAKRHLLDIVGVGLLGSQQPVAARALVGIDALAASAGGAQVWGASARLPAPLAAMANGVASHVLDFDDTHTDSITHGSAILGPLVFALGEEMGRSGKDLIVAFVAGWEVLARVGLASRGSFHKRGFHTTSVAGIFGAVAAAGKLLGLSRDEMSHAFGLCGSQASGVSEYLSNGSSSKSFHPGWAAHAAIIAAHLAKAGMTGPMTIFEGRYSLFRTYGLIEDCALDELTADLGRRWETTRISIKPYPCCHFAHAFIDCARGLREKGLRAEDIDRLECVVPEIEVALICEPFAQKLRPENPYGAKFSLPYLVAAGLIDGTVGQKTFTMASIGRADLLALADRVTYRLAREGETTFPKYFPGWIQGRRQDGTPIEQRLDVNYGNPDNPMRDDDIVAKFRDNAAAVLSEARTTACLGAFRSLESARASDVAELLAPYPRNQRKGARREISG
jgi:2-methylcitrate dehydratase PrpD